MGREGKERKKEKMKEDNKFESVIGVVVSVYTCT